MVSRFGKYFYFLGYFSNSKWKDGLGLLVFHSYCTYNVFFFFLTEYIWILLGPSFFSTLNGVLICSWDLRKFFSYSFFSIVYMAGAAWGGGRLKQKSLNLSGFSLKNYCFFFNFYPIYGSCEGSSRQHPVLPLYVLGVMVSELAITIALI